MASVTRYADFDLGSGANDGTSEADAWQTFGDMTSGLESHFTSNPSDKVTCYIQQVATPVSGTQYSWTITASSGPIQDGLLVLEGYKTTPGDGVNGPSYWFRHEDVFAINSVSSVSNTIIVRYIDVDSSRSTSGGQLRTAKCRVEYCRARSTYASGGPAIIAQDGELLFCHAIQGQQITSRSSTNVAIQGNRTMMFGCVVEGGISLSVGYRPAWVVGCCITKGENSPTAGDGIYAYGGLNQSGIHVVGCSIFDVPGDGIYIEDAPAINNNYRMGLYHNIIYTVGGYAVRTYDATYSEFLVDMVNNFLGNYTSGATSGIPSEAISGTQTLTANPFTDAANLDFSINDTSGGGALVKANRIGTVMDTFFGAIVYDRIAGSWQETGGGGGTRAYAG